MVSLMKGQSSKTVKMYQLFAKMMRLKRWSVEYLEQWLMARCSIQETLGVWSSTTMATCQASRLRGNLDLPLKMETKFKIIDRCLRRLNCLTMMKCKACKASQRVRKRRRVKFEDFLGLLARSALQVRLKERLTRPRRLSAVQHRFSRSRWALHRTQIVKSNFGR